MPSLHPSSLGRHLDSLYRAAWGLCGAREDAEDLVQETLTRVLARPREVAAGGERAYLLSALRHTFYSRLRTASRRPQVSATLDDLPLVEPRGETQPERAVEVAEVFAAIATLPDDFRLALVAIDVLGLSYGEAAQALGVLEATITTRVYRARRRVVRLLDGDAEIHPPPAAAEPAGTLTKP